MKDHCLLKPLVFLTLLCVAIFGNGQTHLKRVLAEFCMNKFMSKQKLPQGSNMHSR